MSSILKVDQLQDTGGNAILTSDGAGNITTPGITTGKVLQVVSSVHNTITSTSSTSMVTTGHSATITPSSTSSKILMFVNGGNAWINATATNVSVNMKMYYTVGGGSSTALTAQNFDWAIYGNITSGIVIPHSFNYLHSPATTSELVYTVFFRNQGSASTVFYINDHFGGTNPGNISLTLMEIAG